MPPFTVLHICVGNICRSPMAERLLLVALRRLAGRRVDQFYLSHGAGTGSWHTGEPMNAPAARELAARGADTSGFRARRVRADMIDTADLVLCATSEQVRYVAKERPDAIGRTFVLGEFGRLLSGIDLEALPPVGRTTDDAYHRGVALVAAVDAARQGTASRAGSVSPESDDRRLPSRVGDDLDDPWGMGEREFARVADEIERTVVPLAAALTG